MELSAYHIKGWFNAYECVTDIEGVRNVIQLGELMQGYSGPGVIRNEWNQVVFQTIEEVGLGKHPEVRRLPNDRWTEVISEADWPAIKNYIENKLNPATPKAPAPAAKKSSNMSRDQIILEAFESYDGPMTKRKALPKVRPLRQHRILFPPITVKERNRLWKIYKEAQ